MFPGYLNWIINRINILNYQFKFFFNEQRRNNYCKKLLSDMVN